MRSRIVSWVIIALAAMVLIGVQAWRKAEGGPRSGVGISFELSGKYAVGLRGPTELLDKVAHTYDEKLALAVVRVALGKSVEQALKELPRPTNAEEIQTQADLRQVLLEPLSPAAEGSIARVKKRLGWFGELAATYRLPQGDPKRRAVDASARTVVVALITALLVLAAMGFAGLALLITATVMFAMGKLKLRFKRGPASPFLLEAFAIYLGGMAAADALVVWLMGRPPLWASVMILFCFPLALLWPKWRRLSWREWREALGFSAGRGFLWEVGAGLVGYVAGLPIVGMGMLMTAVLSKLSSMDSSHPIINQLRGSRLHFVILFLLASVYAPFTEELLFRGALLGYLRQRWPFVPAALVVSVIFAAIHPQGWPAIPVLASLAFVLAMIREWRGSIVGCMAAHALNNGMVLIGIWVLLA